MTAKEADVLAEPRVTIDDLRHRAEAVKSKALSEAKETADAVVRAEATRTLAIVAGLVVVAASVAFFLGTRTGRQVMAEQTLGE